MSIAPNHKKNHQSQEKWHLLLIESQDSIAKTAANLIKERWDCHVTIAKNYQQTQKLLATKADRYFVSVTNLTLPDAPNGEIIPLLRAHKQTVIAITDHVDHSEHDTLMETGIIDYVLKNNINAYQYLVDFVGRLYANSTTTVMVIDDSAAIRERTAHFLRQQFLTVVYAKNGQEGLDLLQANPAIKLVLVDSEMPVMNGLTFTAKARQIKGQNALTIIGISGSEGSDLSTQFLKHGANDFISKPFSYGELTCRVNQNLNLLDYIEEVHNTANKDFLTQLPNRRYFFEQGNKLFKAAQASQSHTIIGVLDIDHFKQFNDQYGHDCGDLVLQAIGNTISTTLVDQHAARTGGEEFAFIITTPELGMAEALVQQLHQAIAQQVLEYQAQVLSITASIGYTAVLQNHLDETLRIADQHLYAAKTAGRNQIINDSRHAQL